MFLDRRDEVRRAEEGDGVADLDVVGGNGDDHDAALRLGGLTGGFGFGSFCEEPGDLGLSEEAGAGRSRELVRRVSLAFADEAADVVDGDPGPFRHVGGSEQSP